MIGGFSRHELDSLPQKLNMKAVFDEDDKHILVNGMLGKYKLWVSKADQSITPCLLGDVGGMPGAWENWVSAWHTNNFRHYENYIDIGANAGYFAFMADYYGLNVIAVEANPEYAALIRESNRMNGADVIVVNAAVSDSIGKVTLHILDDFHGSSSLMKGSVDDYAGHTEEVPSTTIDKLTEDLSGRTLIKMDIEGAEELAWQGAVETNKSLKPTYVIEYTPESYSGDFGKSLFAYGAVSLIGTTGHEMPVTRAMMKSAKDWMMLVVRPR